MSNQKYSMRQKKLTPAPSTYPMPVMQNYVCLTCGHETESWSHPNEHTKTTTRKFWVNGITYEQEYEVRCGRYEQFTRKIKP